MGLFTDTYKNLLIVQYSDKPKAQAHIKLIIGELEKVYQFANQFDTAFDVDLAVGKQLDIIGKIVGINRIVPFAVPKNYFGFDGHEHSFPMNDKFKNVVSYPMKSKFEIPFTSGELNDLDYRFYIKAKIVKNYAKATMIDKDNLSLQNAVDYLFNNKSYLTDAKNMSINLYIGNDFDFSKLQFIKQLDIIPRPQAVKIYYISYVEKHTFGFYEHNTGFGDKFDDKDDETYFANKILE